MKKQPTDFKVGDMVFVAGFFDVFGKYELGKIMNIVDNCYTIDFASSGAFVLKADVIHALPCPQCHGKGEITLMISKGDTVAADPMPMEAAFDKLLAAGVPRMDAMKTLARERGLSKREVYLRLNER